MPLILTPTLHPAALLRGTDNSGLAKFERTVVADLAKAKRFITSRPNWDESIIHQRDSAGRMVRCYPTADEAVAFLRRCLGKTLAVDVETTGESPLACQLICVGIGSTDGELMNVPFFSQGGRPYWTGHDFERVWRALVELMADYGTAKIFHNFAFDTMVLWARGAPVRGVVYCTMAAHHVVDGELPHSLAYSTSLHTDGRYWKDDVKGDVRWMDLPDDTMRVYNLRDILGTLGIAGPLHQEVQRLGLWNLYREEIDCAQVMARATIRGIGVDFHRRDSTAIAADGLPEGLGPRLHVQMNGAIATLRTIAGTNEFDPGKPTHLAWLLFQRLQLPILKMAPSGRAPSTDKEAMMMLALAAQAPEARAAIKALADFRMAQKMLSTFVEGLAVLNDGRFHPTWKLLAVTGRFTSSPNAQNWPKKLKRIFCAGPGRKLVGVDLSQAELRGIAYFSGHKQLLQMYRDNINVHSVNAAVLFRIKPPKGHKDMDPATEAYCRQIIPQLLTGEAFDLFPEMGANQWGPTRTLAKNDFFGRAYGAMDETVADVLRSKRDPDTNDLLFPNLTLADVEATGVIWKQVNRDVVKWWDRVQAQIKAKGCYQCPVSGRIRWFRGGFKRNEMLNVGIQTLVASVMNKRMLEIQAIFDKETGGEAQVIQQVHDALNSEVPAEYVARAKEVKQQVLSQPFPLRVDPSTYYPDAVLPPDKPTEGQWLDQV